MAFFVFCFLNSKDLFLTFLTCQMTALFILSNLRLFYRSGTKQKLLLILRCALWQTVFKMTFKLLNLKSGLMEAALITVMLKNACWWNKIKQDTGSFLGKQKVKHVFMYIYENFLKKNKFKASKLLRTIGSDCVRCKLMPLLWHWPAIAILKAHFRVWEQQLKVKDLWH